MRLSFSLPRALWLAGAVLGLLASTHRGSATTVVAPTFETMVDRAELIFTGQMLHQRSEWRVLEGNRSIVTLVTFGLEKLHKGSAGATVTLQFLGGKIGDVSLEVSEMPRFQQGERVLLFVEGNGVAASPVIGFYHGRFKLRRERDGTESMLLHNGEELADTTAIGQPRRAKKLEQSRALSHGEFTAQIRARAALRQK